ncbi:MAG: double-strand break repair protein AddB [Rhizobiaceae bacterium]
MTVRDGGHPRVLSIPPGAPFLPTLARALKAGQLVPGFDLSADPLALSRATIYVPTRRAARALRAVLASLEGGRPAILPTIKALGEFDEGEAAFDAESAAVLDLAPPMGNLDRLLLLAPIVQAWKRQLPAHVAKMFEEEVVVPVSTADSLWLARDLARLMDDVETEQTEWAKLASLVSEDYAGWWQVTLKFLEIVTDFWPQRLIERGQSNPAAHRNALIAFEAERLKRQPPAGPIIAAGSTGSIPATAGLLATIARLPNGAVVLPGLDLRMDEASWAEIARDKAEPPVVGHPQYGLARLMKKLGAQRGDVIELGSETEAIDLSMRTRLVSDALRPAETTDAWLGVRTGFGELSVTQALSGVTLIEAANERDEALAIALALRHAVIDPGKTAALVTGDRNLARRVSSELLRFDIQADDSGGAPLASTPPAALLLLMARAIAEPGDPVTLLSLIKHPLVRLGLDRAAARSAAEIIELVALRCGTGRPDIATLTQLFDARLAKRQKDSRIPRWFRQLQDDESHRVGLAHNFLARLNAAMAPCLALRLLTSVDLAEQVTATIRAFEALGRDEQGSVAELYGRDAGEKLAEFLRGLVGATAPFAFAPKEWPDILDALIATETVKPRAGADRRISIWGALEARLQSVDTLVLGGLNEGSWPRKAESDRFLSRIMRSGIDLEPPERQIGLAAHDFEMALGAPNVVLSRAARSGDAPAVASRWLQRLTTFAGPQQTEAMRVRGNELLDWARQLDESEKAPFAPRPEPTPPVEARPKHFSVTEIETLRRDPYAIYARRILKLQPIDPLIRDPNAAERGSLFHDILHRFSVAGVAADDPVALARLLEIGRTCFEAAELPPDVDAVWWPRFEKLAVNILDWERTRSDVVSRHAEARAAKLEVGGTDVTLSGYADRIDLLPAGMADILDYKTGSSPSKVQAHTLLAPQLALEAALLRRGAFEVGEREPADLAFIRLRANGDVESESILQAKGSVRSADDLGGEAWARLEDLLTAYNNPARGYKSRALPFREGDVDGDYDHLARVLEWSAGGDDSGGAE